MVKHILKRIHVAAHRREQAFPAMSNTSEEEFKWGTLSVGNGSLSLWVMDYVRMKYPDDSKALDVQ
jgi:hypothetical protein